jgi:beta-lactamase regulating signal transducer with metallopeptidase domain
MPTLVQVGLANAAAAALLALVALAAGRWCRRPALVHSLWLLVLVKLVTPPLFPLELAWLPAPVATTPAEQGSQPSPEPRADGGESASEDFLGGLEAGEQEVLVVSDEIAPNTGQAEERSEAAPPSPSPAVVSFAPSAWDFDACARWFGMVWLAGSVLCILWAGTRIWRFHCLLRFAQPAPASLQEIARQLSSSLGLTRCPTLWLLPGPLPPMVWAAGGSARIYFPAALLERLNADEQAALLAHELAHVRRRDHWVRWLELLVLALYWWYPLAWWVRRRLQLWEEECCDAWVVGELAPRAYASAILATIDFLAGVRAVPPAMASPLGRVHYLKRRLTLIMSAATPKRLTPTGRLAVLAVAGLLLPLLPMLVRSPMASPEPVEKPPEPVAVATANEEPINFDPVSDLFLDNGELPITPADEEMPDLPPWTVEAVLARLKVRALALRQAALAPEKTIWVMMAGPGLALPGAEEASRGPAILAAAYSPDGRTLALAFENGTVELRDADTGELRHTLTGHTDAVTCLAYSPDGKTLATGSPDRTVKLWDPDAGRERRTLTGHTSWVYAVTFSSDGQLLASGGYDRTIRLWDPATGRERASLTGHASAVRALAFARDGKTLASGGGDQTVRLWDLTTLREHSTLRGHGATVRALAFSPDGKTLATAGEDSAVKLWDPASGQERATLKGHQDVVWSLAFSPQGNTLVTGSQDTTVRVWDPATGAERATLRGHDDGVAAVAFAPGGKRLASAGHDRTVRLWRATDRVAPPPSKPVSRGPAAVRFRCMGLGGAVEGVGVECNAIMNPLANLAATWPIGSRLQGLKVQISQGLTSQLTQQGRNGVYNHGLSLNPTRLASNAGPMRRNHS